jgi:hypothetical protein
LRGAAAPWTADEQTLGAWRADPETRKANNASVDPAGSMQSPIGAT